MVAHALTDDSVYTYVKNVPAAYIDQLGLRPPVGDSGFLFLIYLCNGVCGNDNGEVIPPSVEHPAGSYTGYSKDVDDVIPGLSEKLYEAIINKHRIPEFAAFGRNKKLAHYIDAQVREYVISVRHSLPCGTKKLDDFMTRNTYDFTSVLFAIGKATVATNSSINFQWKIEPTKKATYYEWTAKMNIYFFDVFKEPFYTETEVFGIRLQLGTRVDVSTPFALYHSWEDGLPLASEGFIQL